MRVDKIKGVLVGCAYGDAMGMPTENMSREAILKQYPQGITSFYPSLQTGAAGRVMAAGEVTDDTIHTLILLQCLIEHQGKPLAAHYMSALRTWMIAHPDLNEVIIGRSTRRAMEAIDQGEDMATTGIWGTTNGASMKISPIGMISDYHAMEELVQHVYEICYPTHNTELAIQGACVIAALVSYALQDGSIDGIWDIAYQAIDGATGKGVSLGGPKLTKRIEAIRRDIETKSEEAVLALLADFYGTGVETIETIPVVLALLYLGHGEPIRIGQMSATLGGDTDTIGAIACGIAGAFHPDFPEEVVAKLASVNHINFDELSEKMVAYCIDPMLPDR